MSNIPTTQNVNPLLERDFHKERLTARLTELRQQHEDQATFMIKSTELLETVARNDADRKSAQDLLRLMKAAAKLGLWERGDE